MNIHTIHNAITDAENAVLFVRQDYSPGMQPTTWERLNEALNALQLAWDAVQDAADAAYDEPRPSPNYEYEHEDKLDRQSVVDDYYEDCKADAQRTGRL